MSRTVYSPRLNIRRLVLPVNQGGTATNNISEIADNLFIVTNSKKEQNNGVAALNSFIKIAASRFNINSLVPKVNLDGNFSVFINQTVQFTITDYDIFKQYTISVDRGTISRSGPTLTYTAPGTTGAVNLTINGRVIQFNVSVASPQQPVISSPANGASNLGPGLSVTASAFVAVGGSFTHTSTDWQLATDAAFTNVVQSSIDDTVNKTSWNLASGLNVSTTYYLRCRYKGSNGNFSAYSATISFSTKATYDPVSENAKLISSTPGQDDYFGLSVSIDSTGTRAVVGASGVENSGQNIGSIYVFLRTGNTWNIEATLFTNIGSYANQGWDIDIDSSGTRVIVGTSVQIGNGFAFVYIRSGTSWTRETTLYPNDGLTGGDDKFGAAVGINSDGDRIIIGGYSINRAGYDDIGCAYIFSRSGSTWTQEAILFPAGMTPNRMYSWSVDIDSTGTRAVVGCPRTDISGLNYCGEIYIWIRSGTAWSLESRMEPQVPLSSHQYGYQVAIDSSGTRIAVTSLGSGAEIGSIYIIVRSGTTWTQEAKLVPTSAYSGVHSIKYGVCFNDAGDRLVAGRPQDDSNGLSDSGRCFYYTRTGNSWSSGFSFVASDAVANDQFGTDVAISGNGNYIISSSYRAAISGVIRAGAAYIFS